MFCWAKVSPAVPTPTEGIAVGGIWLTIADLMRQFSGEMDIVAFLVERGLLGDGGGYELRRLMGGFWNDVYRLRGNGRDWVVKHFRAANLAGLYPILPEAEALALDTLRGLDIAPEPVVFLGDGRLLVYKFFAGEVWREDGDGIGRLLRRLHGVAVSPGSGFRHLPITPEAILAQGDGILEMAERDSLRERLQRTAARGGGCAAVGAVVAGAYGYLGGEFCAKRPSDTAYRLAMSWPGRPGRGCMDVFVFRL